MIPNELVEKCEFGSTKIHKKPSESKHYPQNGIIAPFRRFAGVTLQKKHRTTMKRKNLPVSVKVYSDLTSRITASLSSASASEAMRLLDSYLTGEPPASDDPMALVAFNMIRPEIDRAMTRSARARERAASRRRQKEAEERLAIRRMELESMFRGEAVEAYDRLVRKMMAEDMEEERRTGQNYYRRPPHRGNYINNYIKDKTEATLRLERQTNISP